MGHKVTQEANEKNVSRTLEQGGLSTTWVADVLLDQRDRCRERHFIGIRD
jgi:hypothetical protein